MFKHYLTFTSLPFIGRIEISEVVGFDKASYKVKQSDGRFARDIMLACEDTELIFTRAYFEELLATQTLPDGQTTNFATHGFDYLIDIFQNECWEGEIQYLIQQDSTDFAVGYFDYVTADIQFDQIKVKIIQNTNREIIKRLEDTDVNAFNDTALDGREITPCETTNILLKAKPITQFGNWKYGLTNPSTVSNIGNFFYNYSNAFIDGNIQNSLSYIQGISPSSFGQFKYLYAQTNLSNVRIEFSNVNVTVPTSTRLRVSVGFDVGTATHYNIDTTSSSFASSYSLDLPDLLIGQTIWIYFQVLTVSGSGSTFSSMDVNITAISTAIDTVVNGVRLIDLVRHNAQSLADVTVTAPQYDSGGEHYDNFAFNGLLLGQITDKPFNNKFKDLMSFVKETCSDYQINEANIEILPYSDFYTDNEMAVFDELPEFNASTKTNKRFTIKTADFKYKRSSDQRQNNSENSIDDVHTETQKFFTDKVDGNLKVELDHIRSAFLIEEARKRAFDNSETTSLQNDENLFLLKCIPLAPSSQGGFGAVLLMQETDTGHLQILNNNTDGDGIDFNWNLLGFGVGSQFFIDNGENVGTWQVFSISNTVLELFPISTSVTFEGEAYINMRWFFTNVLWTNQTNEGYTVIEGVENPTNYSNLDYHWARNIQRWYSYLASATKFKPDGVIKTASFKTNGDLQTRKSGESENVIDSADIINSEIASLKILNPFVHSVKIYADLETMSQLINDVQTIKGYVTLNLNDGRTIKGHIKEMDYTFITEELDLEVEERFIDDFMEITSDGITYPNYPEKNNLESFQINNIFVLLFDGNDVQLYPPIRFTNVKINGVAYTDIVEFTDALTELLET